MRDDAIRVPLIRYALAVLRMRIRPALEDGWDGRDPIHVAMFGGTNSGKSTALNVLLGTAAAGMSSRARFTQHPVAYRPDKIGNQFLTAFPSRFLGYAVDFDRIPPRQEDLDLKTAGYRPALAVCDPSRMAPEALATGVAGEAVFWDIPDFSTDAAIAYMGAVLDTAALADLLLMVVTPENYADDRAGRLRTMIASSGTPIRFIVNKLEEGSLAQKDGTGLIDDIALKLGIGGTAMADDATPRLLALPRVLGGDEGRLARLLESPEAEGLRLAVREDLAAGIVLKRRVLAYAVDFLERRLPEILKPLSTEVAIAEQWAAFVEKTTRHEFLEPYRREYLDGAKYGDFNLTLVKLMSLLEIPKIGQVIAAVSNGLKGVSQRLVAAVVQKAGPIFGRPKAPPKRLPEEEILSTAFERWRRALANEAQLQAQKGEHPAWRRIAAEMGSGEFIDKTAKRFGHSYNEFRDQMELIIAQRARHLYEVIERDKRLLNTLRGLKLTLDVGATVAIVSQGGIDLTDVVIGPLVAPIQRLILEYGLERMIDGQKDNLKQEQFEALRGIIQKDMVMPVLDLFRGEADPEDIRQALLDFAVVKEAALAVAGPETNRTTP